MATLEQVTQSILLLANLPNCPINAENRAGVVNTFFVVLADLPEELVKAAAVKYLSEKTFFPTPGDLRQMAVAIRADANDYPSPLAAWEEVCRAERPNLPNWKIVVGGELVDKPPYRWSHPLVEKCARRFGWFAGQFPGENPEADRAHFMRAYEGMMREEIRAETQLPAITEYVQRERIVMQSRRAALETGERSQVMRELMASAFDRGERRAIFDRGER